MNQGQKLQALSVEYKVNFINGKKKGRMEKKPVAKPQETPTKLPRITRLLALAHHLQDLLDQGIVKDYADIARLSCLSRARVTQIMNLTLLAPEIQEDILLINSNVFTKLMEKVLRMVIRTLVWEKQVKIWKTQIFI